jgi:allantoin racemase
MRKRIANLCGAGGREFGSAMPEWAVSPGFSSELVETPLPTRLANVADFHLNGLMFVETAVRLEKQGYDAIIINSFGDYGIEPMRAAVSIPVIGPGQTSMTTAANIGRKFAIVTVWPPALRHIYERSLHDARMAQRCAGLWFVTDDAEIEGLLLPDGPLDQMKKGQGGLMDRVEARCREAIAAGADVILQGCTCMSPVRDEMARRLPKPVLDPLVLAQKTAEMYVQLGIRHPAAEAPFTNAEALHAMFAGTLPAAPGVGLNATTSANAECVDGACEVLRQSVV